MKKEVKGKISLPSGELFSLNKNDNSTELVVTLLVEQEKVKIPTEILQHVIADALKEIIFSQLFPRPFIASAERTGAAIFRKELNFARNRLLEEIGQADYKIDPRELLFRGYQDYPLPVEQNVEFTRELETIFKKRSFLYNNHPEVLNDFADIIGGDYTVTSNDELYYLPQGKRVKLSMLESSSAVRSLLDIGFYLKHEAQLGDLLIIDEPELNLHPENQRRVARLFARLINLGIKVFITTHSDYIIKELNTLIMLNHDKPHLKRIAEEEGYQKSELISAEQIKVYIAEEKDIQREGNKRKTKCQSLTLANIDPEMGIEPRSFDTTIEQMNRIQEAIVWGED
ncbi:AAA family ATPase [Okeania sp.]|uniref:AAA family ATPase n=1 Tax=Okeania sp. TaxID=3100323 RepID=UPI002B4B1CAF|nr:AAA family ATPase [Okeania sp.]MEB3341688.1 AAA family ATPase [Okeania sp.]